MSRAWVFQANPRHYDIDGALAGLDRIWWRVPQYTAEVQPGDVVVLWRSGREAGVVGVGRVVEPPQVHDIGQGEQEFVVDEAEEAGPTTRVLMEVTPTAVVGKERVRAIPEMAEHLIVRAPMGTVFPLSSAEWSALAPHVADPPEIRSGTASPLPPVFAWEQRAKGVLPMPGGYDGYLSSAREVCEQVDQARPTPAELAAWLAEHFQVSPKGSQLRVSFLRRTGLVVIEGGVCQVGEWGRQWLDTDSTEIVAALLHSRCQFIGEMLSELDSPHTTEEVLAIANERYGMRWDTQTQVNNRRGWLQSAGMMAVDAEGRLVLSDRGRDLLDRLDLFVPGTPSPPPLPPPSPEPGTATAVETEVRLDVDTLAEEILESATDSTNPNRFERAVRDAFAFLGFDAEWLGGAGRTDVLLDAPLGRDAAYRVAVDAKTTASGALTDQQVDWITLAEHLRLHDADYMLLVAPSPSPGRLLDRAQQQSVAVLSAVQLAGLCRQHARIPLGLGDYRSLFVEGGGVDTSGLDELAEEQARLVTLAVGVVHQLADRSPRFGPLTARDLWMVLAIDDAGEITSEEEIQSLLATMSSPLVRVVDGTPEGGYVLTSAPEVARLRLRLLGDALCTGSTAVEEP